MATDILIFFYSLASLSLSLSLYFVESFEHKVFKKFLYAYLIALTYNRFTITHRNSQNKMHINAS